MFFLEKEYLLWAFILIISDIVVTYYMCKFEKSSSLESKVIIFLNETLFFVPFRIVWIYRSLKYVDYFFELKPEGTNLWLGTISILEFLYEFVLILGYFYNLYLYSNIYKEMEDNASNCSLKLFLQLNKFNKIETKENSILYVSSETQEVGCWDFYEKRNIKRKIKFNPLALFIVCYIIRNEKKIENKNSKKIQQKEFDEKFYKMVISDLEKIKNDNLEKSSEYLEQVKFK